MVTPNQSFKANVFVSIAITDPGLLKALETVQTTIVSKYPLAASMVIPLHTAHVTLLAIQTKYRTNLKLNLEAAVTKALQGLKNKKLKLEVEGLDKYGYRVVALVQDDLMSLKEALKQELEKVDGVTVESRWAKNNPHVSLFSENFRRFDIPEEALKSHQNIKMGEEIVTTVQIQSVKKSVLNGGNYEKIIPDVSFDYVKHLNPIGKRQQSCAAEVMHRSAGNAHRVIS